jgi:hypothetical protein
MGSEGRRNNDIDEDGGNLLALVRVEGALSAVLREDAGRKRFL